MIFPKSGSSPNIPEIRILLHQLIILFWDPSDFASPPHQNFFITTIIEAEFFGIFFQNPLPTTYHPNKNSAAHRSRAIGAHPTISLIEGGCFTPIILDLCAARSKTCHHPPLFLAQDTCRCNLFTSKLRAKPLSFITPVSNSSWVSKFQAKFNHKSQGVSAKKFMFQVCSK